MVGAKLGMELQAAIPAQEDCLAVVLRQDLRRCRQLSGDNELQLGFNMARQALQHAVRTEGQQ